jgi:hypothetical protein
MILLPTLSLLLDLEHPSAIHAMAIHHLLNLATQSPNSFKEATAGLSGNTKDKMETSIRQAIASRQDAHKAAAAKPQISLKSFG